jgi:hypothetical protein
LDFIYIYGAEDNGYLNVDEWQKMLADHVVRNDFLDNIDDCYIDQEESEEKVIVTDHWSR